MTTKFSEGRHFELARFQALAAEAILRGLGDKQAEEPPPLYAFDPSIGRLTVTTPTYNTALVAVSNGAFPYGGIELARWFDSRQRVISHIGGRAPAGFGLVVRAPNGTRRVGLTAPAHGAPPGPAPDHPDASPQGPIATGDALPALALRRPVRRAGGERLRGARGRQVQVALRLRDRSHPRHLAGDAEPHGCAVGGGAVPELGRGGHLQRDPDGGRGHEAGAGAGRQHAGRSWRACGTSSSTGSESGYVVVPRVLPAGASVARLLFPSEQSSNPRPGPSLRCGWRRAAQVGAAVGAVTMAPARNAAEAAAVVNKLYPLPVPPERPIPPA